MTIEKLFIELSRLGHFIPMLSYDETPDIDGRIEDRWWEVYNGLDYDLDSQPIATGETAIEALQNAIIPAQQICDDWAERGN